MWGSGLFSLPWLLRGESQVPGHAISPCRHWKCEFQIVLLLLLLRLDLFMLSLIHLLTWCLLNPFPVLPLDPERAMSDVAYRLLACRLSSHGACRTLARATLFSCCLQGPKGRLLP